jgi:hypothetical protein
VYSTNEREGFLTKQGCEKIRSSFMNDIYADELKHLYQQQTDTRDLLKAESAKLMKQLADRMTFSEGGRQVRLEFEVAGIDPTDALQRIAVLQNSRAMVLA